MERASRFALEISGDGSEWAVVFEKTDDAIFGGIDGEPFIWSSERPVTARFVRIRLLGRTCFRIFNRIDAPLIMERASRFALEISDDDSEWAMVFEKADDTIFGGIDGEPFIWSSERPVTARFVRIRLLGRTCLHLDQVEVYGER